MIQVLIPVAVIWSIAAITPGPNFFITVHTAVDETRRNALFTVMGIVLGTLIWSSAGFFGITVLFRTLPALYYVLKLVGGLYLISLGMLLVFRPGTGRASAPPAKRLTPIGAFRLGFLTNILNPKSAAFISSLYAASIPAHAPLELGLSCIALICGISALWYALVALAFSHNRAKAAYHRMKTGIQRTAGVIFIGFGVKLALAK